MNFNWAEEPGPWNNWKLFDDWRSKYDGMSLQDQIEFHSEFYKRWTVVHQHGDDRPVDKFFADLKDEPLLVLEIGGWDGAAAARILPDYDNILHWRNYEICAEAVDNPVTNDVRYAPVVPPQWPWDMDTHNGYNVLFMQHVIEHMKFAEFEKLLDNAPDIEHVFIQSPLELYGVEWRGYPGCHILEVGWTEVDIAMFNRGFELVDSWWDTSYSTAPENGRTRIYRRYLDAVQ